MGNATFPEYREDQALRWSSLLLDRGASMTYLPDLNVRMNYTGSARRIPYRAATGPGGRVLAENDSDITYAATAHTGNTGCMRRYAIIHGDIGNCQCRDRGIYICRPFSQAYLSMEVRHLRYSTRITVDMAYDLQQPQYYMVARTVRFADAQWQGMRETVLAIRLPAATAFVTYGEE